MWGELACLTSYLRLHSSDLKNLKNWPPPLIWKGETKLQMLLGLGWRPTKPAPRRGPRGGHITFLGRNYLRKIRPQFRKFRQNLSPSEVDQKVRTQHSRYLFEPFPNFRGNYIKTSLTPEWNLLPVELLQDQAGCDSQYLYHLMS